jgi:hypothetical protein
MTLIDKLFEYAGNICKADGRKEANAETLGLARSLHEHSKVRREALTELLVVVAQDKSLVGPKDCQAVLKDFAAFMIHYFPEHPTFIQVGSPGEWVEAFTERINEWNKWHKKSIHEYVKENQDDPDHTAS